MRGSSLRRTDVPVKRSAITIFASSCCFLLLGPGGQEHAVDNALVTGAPADVARQRFPDLGLARIRVLGEKGRDLHHESGGAEAALKAVTGGQRLLQGVEVILVGQA